MPVKSNVRKSSSKSGGFKFKWWMGLGLVAIIAVIGVVVVRFSNAGGNTYPDTVKKVFVGSDGSTRISLNSSGYWYCFSGSPCFRLNTNASGNTIYDVTCANISSQGWKNSRITSQSNPPGSVVTVSETKTIPASGTPAYNACK